MFEKLTEKIYRLCVPFDNIYTSVFALLTDEGIMLADSGSKSADAEKYIIPSVKELGKEVKYLVSSHNHCDHSGGLERLKKEYPNTQLLSFSKETGGRLLKSGEEISGFRFYNLKGHTSDSTGIFEEEEKAVLTFDSIQLCGVGRYGSGITNIEEYLKTVEKIRSLSPQIIIASHDFVPFGFTAKGEKEVNRYLDFCIEYTQTVADFVNKNKALPAEKIAEKYNGENPHLPPLDKGKIEIYI